jgi:hypothetical protein
MGLTDLFYISITEINGQVGRSRKLFVVCLKIISRRVGFVLIDEVISIIIYSVNCK